MRRFQEKTVTVSDLDTFQGSFSEKSILFFKKKTKVLNVFKIFKQKYNLRRILETFVTISVFELFQGIVSEKSNFFPKKPIYWRFWEFLSNNTIWDAFWNTFSWHLAVLKHFKALFRKKTHFFRKKLQFWMFWDFLITDTIWDVFFKKFATFGDFEKIQSVFRETHVFSKKKTNFERFEVS